MNLQARSMGALIEPDRISGKVHSVFQNACNLRLASGELVVLLVRNNSNVPHGIRLDTPGAFSFEKFLPVGSALHVRAGVVRFEAPSPFAIDLRHANVWHCPISALGMNMAEQPNLAAWRMAANYIRHNGTPSGLGNLAVWPGLRAAIFQLATKQAACLLQPFVGRGPGLTPSGDDFIVGILAGLWAQAGHDPKRLDFITTLTKLIKKSLTTTTDISQAYLSAACQGEFSQNLSLLACAIARSANFETLKPALDQALSVGHTSGVDSVAGLLAGLSAWCPVLDLQETFIIQQGFQGKTRAA